MKKKKKERKRVRNTEEKAKWERWMKGLSLSCKNGFLEHTGSAKTK